MKRRRIVLTALLLTVTMQTAVARAGGSTNGSARFRIGPSLPLRGATEITAGGGSVWATGSHQVIRIDPRRGHVVGRVHVPGLVGSVAVAGRLVWVLSNPTSTTLGRPAPPSLLWSVDANTDRIVGKPIALRAEGELVAAAGSLWVANGDHAAFGRLYRVNPKTRQITARIKIPNAPVSIAVAAGSLWIGESDAGLVDRVDPKSASIQGRPIKVGGALLTLAADDSRVWVANSYSGTLSTIDARDATVTSTRPLAGVTRIAVSGGAVWATFARRGEVARLSTRIGGPTTLAMSFPLAFGILAVGTAAWVTGPRGVTRISP